MLVVASLKVNKKKRMYHKCGCIYASRIKTKNRIEMDSAQAGKRRRCKCKYCSGLQGDLRILKSEIDTWSGKKHMQFIYREKTNTLYIQTEIGFWKVFMAEESGKYLLYHKNSYTNDMDTEVAINGDFHRQGDVKETESLVKIVHYIIAHDRAKVTIMNDYRNLPRSTKKQKRYYEIAKRKDRRNAARRVDDIFAALEKSQADLKKYSFC